MCHRERGFSLYNYKLLLCPFLCRVMGRAYLIGGILDMGLCLLISTSGVMTIIDTFFVLSNLYVNKET
jgi:hypothetical protein